MIASVSSFFGERHAGGGGAAAARRKRRESFPTSIFRRQLRERRGRGGRRWRRSRRRLRRGRQGRAFGEQRHGLFGGAHPGAWSDLGIARHRKDEFHRVGRAGPPRSTMDSAYEASAAFFTG